MQSAVAAVFPIFFLTAAASAQCAYQSVSSTSYGGGCSEVTATVPQLAAQLDVVNCSLELQVDAAPGCCNTWPQAHALIIGFHPVNVPLPWSAPGCTLLVQPDLFFVQPASNAGSFVLALPPALPPVTFFAQGAAAWQTTVTFPATTPRFGLTPGYTVTLN